MNQTRSVVTMNAVSPTCDVCGEPAIHACVDTVRDETDADGSGWVRFYPAGPVKFGCKKHPFVSVTVRTDRTVQYKGFRRTHA